MLPLPSGSILTAAVGLLVACRVDPSYDGTSYRCDLDGLCPAGQSCVDGRCVGPAPDAAIGALEFVDDALAGEFGEGAFEDAEWSGVEVRLLATETAGTFTSRVFDAGADVAWRSLAWVPSAPYGKPMPDERAAEAGYAEGALDMAEDVLLLHLDAPGALGAGAAVADRSGRGNDATVVTGSALNVVAGQIGDAVEVSPGNHLEVATGSGSDLETASSDYTWALWMRTSSGCEGNRVALGTDDNPTDGAHVWLGCWPSTDPICPSGGAGARAGGTMISNQGAEEGAPFCGTTVINDGAWHHLAVTKSGHAAATIALYVDGALEQSVVGAFGRPMLLPNAPPFKIGAFPDGGYDLTGALDEIAIWRRALAADEVLAVYRRGAARMSLEVRACQQADCADAPPFVGPDGAGSAFVDPAGGLAPPGAQPLPALDRARYFQYRVTLAGAANAIPGVRAVTVTADP